MRGGKSDKMNMNLRKQFLAAACVYLGQSIVGYCIGWTAPVIQKLQNADETPLDAVLTDPEAALVGSIFFVGTTIGPYIAGYVSNVLGRRICLFSAGVTTVISLLMLALAKNVALIYVGRVFGGMGTSVIFIMSLVYVGEIASTGIRGILLTLVGLSGSFGTLLVYSYGPFVSYAATCWLPLAMAVVYLCLLYTIPESPVYQVMVGKSDEAAATLISLGRENDVDTVLATANEKETKNNLSLFTDMYRVKANRMALFLLITLNVLQQMSGFYSMILFATNIFDMSGSSMESHISTIILGVTQLVSSLAAPFFIENVGRRPLLLMSTAISTISLTTLATYFYLYETEHPVADKLSWLSLTSLIVYFLAYTIGLGVIPNTLSGEMFTSNVRSIGTSVSLTVSWIVGFGVSTAFGYMIPAWGAAITFWIYSGACAVAFIFSVIFVPETKGKTLLEIQDMLNK
ncbi:unnamed protein product [Chrysodeixis includens]|uniref:Major facilitator superfamily (MFS) profile domain-containing protein n=1 Tax=Chrysodeixis includens TaxID=689277 RepID=A0A9P0BWG0_CHRIL|nr:unnamed protein product [Chrysodeixis includens]